MDGCRGQAMWTDPPYGVDYVGKTPKALRITGDQAAGLDGLDVRVNLVPASYQPVPK